MTYQFDQQLAIDWAIRIGSAILILIVAHFVAKAVKWGIAKGIDRIPFLSRRDGATGTSAKPVVDVGERIGECERWREQDRSAERGDEQLLMHSQSSTFKAIIVSRRGAEDAEKGEQFGPLIFANHH